MVLVCHAHKFIYVKPRKTAGTSIEMAFEQACLPTGTQITQGRPALVSPECVIGARDGDGIFYRDGSSIWEGHTPAATLFASSNAAHIQKPTGPISFGPEPQEAQHD